jgi:hypothetical protein
MTYKITGRDAYLMSLKNMAAKLFPGVLSVGGSVELNSLIKDYSQLYDDNLNTYTDTAYRRDVRTDQEKLVDLLQGFFLEDLVQIFFNTRRRIPIRNNQSESGRTIQNLKDIVETDFRLETQDGPLLVEFKTIHFDIAETGFRIKLSNWERYKKENSIILGYEVRTNRFFFINPRTKAWNKKLPESFKGWGNKPCIRFTADDLEFIAHNTINTKHFIDAWYK